MKKTITVAFAIFVAAALCLSAAAFAPQKIKSLHPEFSGRVFECALDGDLIEAARLQSLKAYPGSVLEIVLAGKTGDVDLFYDQNGAPINTADVTASKMRAANVGVRVDAKVGGNLLEAVTLSVKNAGSPAAKPVIIVDFTREFDSVSASDFEAQLCVTIGGEENPQSELVIAGTLGYPETIVTSGDSYVDSQKTVLVAAEDIPGVTIDAGYGIILNASMSAGGRYFAAALESGDSTDMAMFDEYASLVNVIKLDVSGFNAVGGDYGRIENVSVSSEQILYVYAENGQYLNTTQGLLPFLEKYYVFSKEVRF